MFTLTSYIGSKERIVSILYLIYCNYYHIYPITFFLHKSPSLFCHGTAFISYSLHAHLYHLAVFFSLLSANMVLLSFSFICLLSYLLINTPLAAYFSLFAPYCYCPQMFTVLYYCIFLYQHTLCSLHTPCLLHARSAMHSYCPCTLIAYLPLYVPL